MNKIIKLYICIFLCALLSACAGPGTGPYGRYTAADRYRDNTNTVLAVGAVAIGASILSNSRYRAGWRDGRRAIRIQPRRRAHR
ncbi:MAG: hypothetical protein D3923_00290 [Candidatus Electrothrix sp. AR3]|nr:hypothetical protein [Candidatus Electrothrix sp. AR3]